VRYFCYIKKYPAESTVVIVDESDERVTLFPDRTGYSYRKQAWLDCYTRECGRRNDEDDDEEIKIYEICENQFKKFAEKGIVPENWEGIWPRRKKRAITSA
jgi:hypothetical protein